MIRRMQRSPVAGPRTCRRTFVTIMLSAPFATAVSSSTQAQARFEGRVLAEWDKTSGRKMILAEPFTYIDAKGRRWPVPKGTVVDGASIPRVFWSVIGGPFEGLYRGASVIHDFYCDARNRRHADVHLVFHEAMLTDGVSPKRAWLMYQAVDRFGPRWEEPQADPGCDTDDPNFDLQRCASSKIKPQIQWPKMTKIDLLNFVKDLEGRVDPADLLELRKTILRSP
jgi:hypothetical protein